MGFAKQNVYSLNKIINIAYIIILSSLWSLSARGQNVFNVTHSVAYEYGGIEIINDTIYTVGGSFNSSGTGSVVLGKTDEFGELISVDTFSQNGTATYAGLMSTWNNKLVLSNVVNTVSPYSGITADLQLSVLDKNFSVFSTGFFGGSAEEINMGLLVAENTFFMFGGTKSFGAGNGDFYLVKIDSIGNAEWNRTYGGPGDEFGRSLLLLEDNTLLIGGSREVSLDSWDVILYNVDSEGEVIWEKQYFTNVHDYIGKMSTYIDGSFILLTNSDDGINRIGYVSKIDQLGKTVWRVPLMNNDYLETGFVKPVINEDGTILICTTIKNANNVPISKVFKLDPLGNTIWSKEYFTRNDIDQYLYDVKQCADGGYILSGSAFPADTNLQSAWLIKTNCNGEEGVQYPVTGASCEVYDCSVFPVNANFSFSADTVDLAFGGTVLFENNSINATARRWDFGDGTVYYTDSLVSHTFTQSGIYTVQLMVFHGACSETMSYTIVVENTAGVDNFFIESALQVYPNPTRGDFTVKLQQSAEGDLKIIDALGRLYDGCNVTIDNLTYSFTQLPKGLFFVELTLRNGIREVKRFEVI